MTEKPVTRWPRLRRWLFRLAAIGVGLAPFVLAEAAFVLLDWGRPTWRDDPFVGFSSVYPLFALSEDGSRYETSPSRTKFFRPVSFAAVKAPDEYRIFCLGGSTVQGRPFSVETSFTTFLELNLRAADPSRAWRVVNCGGISYASYRLAPILDEILSGYEPDLIVLYTGHNEFLEDREYGHLRGVSRVASRPAAWLMATRTYNLLSDGYRRMTGRTQAEAAANRPVLAGEIDAMLDYEGGLARYHRDEQWRRDVVDHFRYNVRRMVQRARAAGVGVLLVDPASNLRNCPPFKSQHREGLDEEQLRQWGRLYARAGELLGTDPRRAAELLRQAEAIDDQYAGLHYLRARALDATGRPEQAWRAYLRARELDVCPLRIIEPMHEALREIAGQTATPLVDVRTLFEGPAATGRGGAPELLDHVHPSVSGHRLIAIALTHELFRLGVVHPQPGWGDRRDETIRGHIDSLDEFYYAKGLSRLESLREWAAGRATTTRPAESNTRSD